MNATTANLAGVNAPQTCRSCGAAVIWLKHVRTGAVGPIDAEPSPEGNCLIDKRGGTYTVLHKAAARAARDEGLPLHRNHFATCPDAESWREVSA